MGDHSIYYVCVDVGGTKIAAVVVDHDGVEVSRGFAPSGNMAELGVTLSSQRIKQAVRSAVQGIPNAVVTSAQFDDDTCPLQVSAAWIGIAGCDSKIDEFRMKTALQEFFGETLLRVTNDSLLLAAPIIRARAPWGICLVAGTGSVISGVTNHNGVPLQFARRGGHGHVCGDEGSAYHLGVTAISAIANAFHCGEDLSSSLISTELCTALNAASPADLPAIIHELDPSIDVTAAVNLRKLRIASLAVPVIASAIRQPDDPLVRSIIIDTADALAKEVAHIVAISLRNSLAPVSEAVLSVVGGLISQPIYLAAVREALHSRGIQFRDIVVVTDAARDGAFSLSLANLSAGSQEQYN